MLDIASADIGRPSDDQNAEVLVRSLTVELGAGNGLGVIGPNGSGKSTLIKTIAGLLPVRAGAVTTKSGTRIGYMPQNYRSGVLSWLSLKEHFRLTLTESGAAVATEFLSEVGFSPKLNRKLAHMSGGEIQIIILSTLIGQDCDLLLLDEPLSAIDFVRRKKALLQLNLEMKRRKRSIVFVSHHLEDAQFIADEIVVLSGRVDVRHKQFKSDEQVDLLEVFS